MNLSKTPVIGLTSKEKDLMPYWNRFLKWLSHTKTGYVGSDFNFTKASLYEVRKIVQNKGRYTGLGNGLSSKNPSTCPMLAMLSKMPKLKHI